MVYISKFSRKELRQREEAEYRATYKEPEPQPEPLSHKDMQKTMEWFRASEKDYAKPYGRKR
jgi:hypothetical protein